MLRRCPACAAVGVGGVNRGVGCAKPYRCGVNIGCADMRIAIGFQDLHEALRGVDALQYDPLRHDCDVGALATMAETATLGYLN